jgi:hypothetical protein
MKLPERALWVIPFRPLNHRWRFPEPGLPSGRFKSPLNKKNMNLSSSIDQYIIPFLLSRKKCSLRKQIYGRYGEKSKIERDSKTLASALGLKIREPGEKPVRIDCTHSYRLFKTLSSVFLKGKQN